MPGKAPAQATEGTVTTPTPAEKMLLKMAGMATMDANATESSINDLNVILEASDEEFWDSDERGAINAKMLSGCVIDITGFDVKFGGAVGDDDITSPFMDPKSGRQMYLMVHSAMVNNSQGSKMYVLPKNDEEFQWNTSARYIVAKLLSAHNRGWLDAGKTMRTRIVGTPIQGGKKRVEKLKEADAPYVASTVQQNGSDEPPF